MLCHRVLEISEDGLYRAIIEGNVFRIFEENIMILNPDCVAAIYVTLIALFAICLCLSLLIRCFWRRREVVVESASEKPFSSYSHVYNIL